MLRAANAAPFVYDRWIEIQGKRYVDAATLDPHALDLPVLKNTKKILIVTKHHQSITRMMTYYLFGKMWPLFVTPLKKHRLKKEIYHQYAIKPWMIHRELKKAQLMIEDHELLLISPRLKLGNNLDNSKETLMRNFKHGENSVINRLDEIRQFFKT